MEILAAYDDQALTAALDDGLKAFTPHSVTDRQVLDKQLDLVRERGWRSRNLSAVSA